MAFWLEMLKEVANADVQKANEIFNFDLPLALCNFSYIDEHRKYQGVIPEKVRSFIANLPESEWKTARSRESDLVDFVLDAVLKQIKRSRQLLQFCLEFSDFDLEKITLDFPDWKGYKRNEKTKQKYVADVLHSIIEARIILPENLQKIAFDSGEAKFEFNEIALARGWNVVQSWNDFKKKQEIGKRYKYIDAVTETDTPEVFAEALEYDIASIGQTCGNFVEDENLSYLQLKQLADKLSPEIENHLEETHTRKPKHGYRPIARHRSFWDLAEKYNVIPLLLQTEEPECRTDQDLGKHISQNYADVEKPLRRNINKRRVKFERECEEKINQRVIEYISIEEI